MSMELVGNGDNVRHVSCCEQQNKFALLLSKKYTKQFHIVDSPALSYSLARKSTENLSIQKLKIKQNITKPIFGITKIPKTRKIVQKTRTMYIQLKNQISTMLQSINHNIMNNKFALSQIFEYNQAVLSGFLSAYLEKIRKQCIQESQFIQYIWNQTMKIMEKIITIQLKSQAKTQKQGLQQLISTHNTYQSTLEIQINKKQKYKQQIVNLKQLVDFLVTKLRIKKKQVKKVYKSQSQLVNKLNQYKDQTVDSELKYIDLKLQQEDLPQKQIDKYLDQKTDLIKLRNKLLKLEQSNQQRIQQIQHQVTIQGRMELNHFIDLANSALDSKQPLTNVQMQAKMDEIFQTLEDQFQAKQFRLKNIQRKTKRMNVPLKHTLNKGTMAKPGDIFMNQFSSQTTYTDKFNCNLINTIGVGVAPHQFNIKQSICVKKKNQQSQCDSKLSKIQSFNGSYQRVIQMSIHNHEILNENLQPDNVKTIFRIKYIEKQSQLLRRQTIQKIVSHKQIQCDGIFMQSDEELQLTKSNQKSRKFFMKKNRSSASKSRFFARQSAEGKLMKSKINKQKISQRYSSTQNSPFKASRKSMLQNQLPKSALSKQQNITNQKDSKQHLKQNIISRKTKQMSVRTKNRRQSVSSVVSVSSKDQQRYTSLSRKTEMQLPQNLEQILKVGNSSHTQKQYECRNYNDIPENRKFHSDQLKDLLLDLSFLSSQDSQLDREQSRQRSQQLQKITIQQAGSNSNRMDNNNKHTKNSEDKTEFSSLSYPNNSRNLPKASSINQQMKIKRNSGTVVENMINKIVYSKINNNQKPYLRNSKKSKLLLQALQPISIDVRKKIKECSVKTKKMILPVKHNNIYSIITSVFSRSWDSIKNNQPIKTFLPPLFQTMNVVYGKMPESQIYKKVINFIAQISLQDDKIYQTFLFFLAMDEKNPYSQQVTSFETYLFLKLVMSLSKIPNPFKQLDTAYTTLQIICQRLQAIFIEDNLPNVLTESVLSNLKFVLQSEDNNNVQIKLGLFSCSKKIIQEILAVNENVKKTFKQLLLISSFKTEQKKISFTDTKLIVECQALRKIQQLKEVKKLLYLKPDRSAFTEDQFISFMLRLKYTSFEELYIRVLGKYQITTFQSLHTLSQMKIIHEKNSQNLKKIKQCRKSLSPSVLSELNAKNFSQIQDIQMLNHAEKITEKVLEKILGKHLNKLYGISVILGQ